MERWRKERTLNGQEERYWSIYEVQCNVEHLLPWHRMSLGWHVGMLRGSADQGRELNAVVRNGKKPYEEISNSFSSHYERIFVLSVQVDVELTHKRPWRMMSEEFVDTSPVGWLFKLASLTGWCMRCVDEKILRRVCCAWRIVKRSWRGRCWSRDQLFFFWFSIYIPQQAN